MFNEIGIIAQLSRTLLEARLPKGIILPHFSVLNHLIRVRDGRTLMELASAFQVPKTSMTHTVGGLEKAGFVTVQPNPADKRSKCVFITSEGRTLAAGAVTALGPDVAELAQDFPLERVQAMLPQLEALRTIMDAKRG
nr:MarR family transcriptional regulator [Nereida sp. MMG025]